MDPSNLQPDQRIDANPIYVSSFSQKSHSIHKIPENFNPSDPRYRIKVIDFGSSCYEDERLYTYVQSRFYRSPEVILGMPYTTQIDMWSLGCILAELVAGLPLFPGENEAEQLGCIMELRGVPPPNIMTAGSRWSQFFGIYV